MKSFLLLLLIGLSTFCANANGHIASTEHHNRYELELSLNDALELEFTGSIYFLPKKKIQVTTNHHFSHFASVVVQELPFEHSKWGTFFGAGIALVMHDGAHGSAHSTNEWAGIVQSGLAYAINEHWSPGFTVSPGYSFTQDNFVVGATLDIVYGF